MCTRVKRIPQLKKYVFSASIFTTQPWLDIPEFGWASLAYVDKEYPNLNDYSRDIAELGWESRNEFFIEHKKPEEFILEASGMKGGLMVVSDSDSTFSGGVGDSTIILRALLNSKKKFIWLG